MIQRIGTDFFDLQCFAERFSGFVPEAASTVASRRSPESEYTVPAGLMIGSSGKSLISHSPLPCNFHCMHAKLKKRTAPAFAISAGTTNNIHAHMQFSIPLSKLFCKKFAFVQSICYSISITMEERMKIDEKIIRELKRAVAASGGASRFADACGIDAANISRYLNGKVHSISDDNWQKLRPHLAVSEAVSARTDGVIANTAELREFIKDAMMRNGLTSAAELTRRIGYDQPDTISRLLAGKLDWFPEVLSQVFATLGIDYDAAPLTRTERELLLPREMFAAGAQLVRPIPVVSWANAASHLAMLGAGETTCRDWNPESTETVLMPIGGRQDTVAFRISGVSMEPALQDNDVILVEPAESLDEIGNKRIVVVHLSESSGCSDEVYCKRFFRIGKKIELRSDNPAGRNLTIVPADIRWIGVAVRKLSEL